MRWLVLAAVVACTREGHDKTPIERALEAPVRRDVAPVRHDRAPAVAPPPLAAVPLDPEPGPMRAPAPLPGDRAEPPCPGGARKLEMRQPVLVASGIHVFHENMPLRWVAPDGHLHELADDPLHPVDLGRADAFKSAVWDDRYWYRLRCYESCIPDTDMGVPRAIERVDRATGETARLGRGDYGMHVIQPLGAYIYAGIYGHQPGGGVVRVPIAGGTQDTVLLGEEHIESFVTGPDGMLVLGTRSVGWIGNTGAPQVLVSGLDGVRAAVRDADGVFVAERGEGHRKSPASGFIHRIVDGKDTRLAGPVRWPSAVATFGPNVYFMLEETGDIWAVPKSGGTPKIVVHKEREGDCDASLGLWATDRGLYWLRGASIELVPVAQRLYFLPWADVR